MTVKDMNGVEVNGGDRVVCVAKAGRGYGNTMAKGTVTKVYPKTIQVTYDAGYACYLFGTARNREFLIINTLEVK